MPATTILCLGLNQRTASLALRERLSCTQTELQAHLAADTAVQNLILLTTCNRIELYATAIPSTRCPHTKLLQLLADQSGLPMAEFAEFTYAYADGEAIAHLLRVAAGLDSLVLGEPQILGQVTDAYMNGVAAGTTGPILDALFKTAIRTGKRVRTETAVASNPATISSISIALAQQLVGDLHEKQTLLLGVGEMGKLALKALQNRKIYNVSVANRTKTKAATAVSPFNGIAYGLDELPQAIAATDLLITAVHSPTPLITANMIAERKRPLIIVDIAVPRNVDTAVAQLPHVHLYDVDDLQATLDESLAARQAEIPKIEAIIADEINNLHTQLRQLTIKPLIVDMRRKAEYIREAELQRTLHHLGEIDPQTLAHFQHFSRSLVNKLLHEPTLCLKQKAGNNEATAYAATVRELFGLVE